MARAYLFLLVALASMPSQACGGCGGDLEVEGEHPYIRCAAIEPRDDEEWVSGEVKLNLRGGALEVDGTSSFLAYALGAGPLPELPEEELHIIFGGFASEEALAKINAPLALLLAGGAEGNEALDDALDTLDSARRERMIDLRGIQQLVIGGAHFVVVPGAPLGRYGKGDDACGYDEQALDALSGLELGERRGLLSWAAPRAEGPWAVDRGFGDVPAGDPLLAELRERLQLSFGLYAWPRTRALSGSSQSGAEPAPPTQWHDDLELVVPALGGVIERFDETRVGPAAVRIEVGAEGLQWSVI